MEVNMTPEKLELQTQINDGGCRIVKINFVYKESTVGIFLEWESFVDVVYQLQEAMLAIVN